MNFEPDKTYHGFKLVRRETIPELNSLALQFEHEATGAELLALENDDDNKVFSVTFRTPPSSDNGVAHILEHSVLCGSRKYPVKEPFIEMVKGSLKTFINAFTFPDKTMYPVASRNIKDLYNLMNVYLDAVFFPKITRETFMQEGWRHEMERGKIVYKGVVFNEMKGAFSDPESLLHRRLAHSLFPDTIYGFESGGDPESIPNLTFEEFRKFHRNYYHPSNSRLFLYGDGPIPDYLKFLHESYLKDFSRQEVNSSVAFQEKFKNPKREEIVYPISSEESPAKKTYVTAGFVLDKASNPEHCLAFNILGYLLLGTPASPLRKALIDSGLGSEVIGGGFDDHRAETLFTVGLKGAEAKDEGKIVDLVFSTLKNLAANGIETDMVDSALNTVEFRLREANFGGFPKGIVYNIQALGSWLYGADPLMHLKYEDLMRKIREESRERYFEKLIQRYLLDNPHRSVVVAIPKPGFAEKQEARTRSKLDEFKASLKPGEMDALAEKTQALQKLQNAPDNPEALASLPKLSLDDLNRNAPRFPLEIKNKCSPEILFHDLFSNKIGYVQIGFNTEAVPRDKIPYLSLLGDMILEMGTRKHSYVEIFQMLGIHTGGIRASHFSSAFFPDPKRVLSYLFFNGKAVLDKLDKLFEIYAELLGGYNFDNPKRLVEIIRSAKADMEASIIPSGNHYVLSRLQSYHSRIGQYEEVAGGLTYFNFLEQLLERAEKNPEETADQFKQVAGLVFTRENMLANITAEEADYSKFQAKVGSLAEIFPSQTQNPARLEFEPPRTNEAFLTASAVQYVGTGANLYSMGFGYTGHFNVLKSVLNTGFLWEKVRMRGGAYGCSASFDVASGDFGLVSYRDPNLTETLDIYNEIPSFIANLELSEEELAKFIIGCVGQLDPPLSPDRKGAVSMAQHLTGLTYETKQRWREELLSTRLKDLKALAPI
ncbi:MAG: insulinase family protein, partial [Nitrospinales bacterium]